MPGRPMRKWRARSREGRLHTRPASSECQVTPATVEHVGLAVFAGRGGLDEGSLFAAAGVRGESRRQQRQSASTIEPGAYRVHLHVTDTPERVAWQTFRSWWREVLDWHLPQGEVLIAGVFGVLESARQLFEKNPVEQALRTVLEIPVTLPGGGAASWAASAACPLSF